MELLDDGNLGGNFREQSLLPSRWDRFFATFLDGMILLGVLYGLLFSFEASFNILVPTVPLLGIPIYKIVLEGLWGATLGKRMMGLSVVQDDKIYSSITIAQANKRFLLAWPMYAFPLIMRFLDWCYYALTETSIMNKFISQLEGGFVVFAVISAASYWWHERQQAWYDRLAGTICVRTKAISSL